MEADEIETRLVPLRVDRLERRIVALEADLRAARAEAEASAKECERLRGACVAAAAYIRATPYVETEDHSAYIEILRVLTHAIHARAALAPAGEEPRG